MTPEALAERILYRDADVLVLDKPPGLAVHRAPGAGATLEPLLASLAFGLKQPPALAHRLDRDTSGCLVLGRHPQALRRLMALFAEGAVDKTYWAVVEGAPSRPEGVAEQPILKVHRGSSWLMIADSAGLNAVTAWRVLGQGDGVPGLDGHDRRPDLDLRRDRSRDRCRRHRVELVWDLGDPDRVQPGLLGPARVGPQSLDLAQFEALMARLRSVAEAVGRTV